MIKDGIQKTDKKIVSFLMIGQSNMAGRGEFKDVEPIRNRQCHMLRMGRWQHMYEPINPDRDIFEIKFHSGVSLAASFADEVAKFSGTDVGIIPCADGGTSITQWQPGEINFDHAVMMTKLAMRTSTLGGIIWHQGESDCKDFNAEWYTEKFLNTMTTLRKELDAENIPLIVGELSERLDIKLEAKNMNLLLHKLADKLPCCGVVSSEGLTLKPDGIHFDAPSLRIFGKRYFEKYIELTGHKKK